MNLNEQLESILANLGVEMEERQGEQNLDEQADENALPELSIFQASRRHYGVFYRLDIIDAQPQLRVMVPVEHGALKTEIYLVRMSATMPLNALFAQVACYAGSPAYEKGREASMQHLLYAVAETMKELFWAGSMEEMRFSPEIEVSRLV